MSFSGPAPRDAKFLRVCIAARLNSEFNGLSKNLASSSAVWELLDKEQKYCSFHFTYPSVSWSWENLSSVERVVFVFDMGDIVMSKIFILPCPFMLVKSIRAFCAIHADVATVFKREAHDKKGSIYFEETNKTNLFCEVKRRRHSL